MDHPYIPQEDDLIDLFPEEAKVERRDDIQPSFASTVVDHGPGPSNYFAPVHGENTHPGLCLYPPQATPWPTSLPRPHAFIYEDPGTQSHRSDGGPNKENEQPLDLLTERDRQTMTTTTEPLTLNGSEKNDWPIFTEAGNSSGSDTTMVELTTRSPAMGTEKSQHHGPDFFPAQPGPLSPSFPIPIGAQQGSFVVASGLPPAPCPSPTGVAPSTSYAPSINPQLLSWGSQASQSHAPWPADQSLPAQSVTDLAEFRRAYTTWKRLRAVFKSQPDLHASVSLIQHFLCVWRAADAMLSLVDGLDVPAMDAVLMDWLLQNNINPWEESNAFRHQRKERQRGSEVRLGDERRGRRDVNEVQQAGAVREKADMPEVPTSPAAVTAPLLDIWGRPMGLDFLVSHAEDNIPFETLRKKHTNSPAPAPAPAPTTPRAMTPAFAIPKVPFANYDGENATWEANKREARRVHEDIVQMRSTLLLALEMDNMEFTPQSIRMLGGDPELLMTTPEKKRFGLSTDTNTDAETTLVQDEWADLLRNAPGWTPPLTGVEGAMNTQPQVQKPSQGQQRRRFTLTPSRDQRDDQGYFDDDDDLSSDTSDYSTGDEFRGQEKDKTRKKKKKETASDLKDEIDKRIQKVLRKTHKYEVCILFDIISRERAAAGPRRVPVEELPLGETLEVYDI